MHESLPETVQVETSRGVLIPFSYSSSVSREATGLPSCEKYYGSSLIQQCVFLRGRQHKQKYEFAKYFLYTVASAGMLLTEPRECLYKIQGEFKLEKQEKKKNQSETRTYTVQKG